MTSQGVRIGPLLRERREALGLSLEDAEDAIRIRTKYLTALEADDWPRLPGEVIGRGFLQNYAEFLKLDSGDLKRRRQLAVDAVLSEAWSGTSAGAPMPTMRGMDYRPMEVPMTGESFRVRDRARELPRSLIFAVFLVIVTGLTLGALWFQNPNLTDTVVDQVESLSARASTWMDGSVDAVRTAWNDALPNMVQNTPTAVPLAVEVPLADATPTPFPTPVPATPTPVNAEAPTLTPTPMPAVSQNAEAGLTEADCPLPDAQITSPLEGQVIRGETEVFGTATHADFYYYKLERAEGAEGQSAFLVFDGQPNAVVNGRLGTLNTSFMVNGIHTIRLTVVEVSAVTPVTICEVRVVVEN